MLQMTRIFLGLVFWNIVLFAAAIGVGLTHQPPAWQFGLGALAGIYTCLVHSIVLMHFLGSGKGIKEAVATYRLPDDPQTGYGRRTRRFKARTSPVATFSCLFIMVAVWLGGWLQTSPHNPAARQWHRWFSWFAVAYNLYAFWVEYRAIRENTAVIREINARITAQTKQDQPSG